MRSLYSAEFDGGGVDSCYFWPFQTARGYRTLAECFAYVLEVRQ